MEIPQETQVETKVVLTWDSVQVVQRGEYVPAREWGVWW